MGSPPTKLRRPATLDHLRAKPLPSRVVEIVMDDDARQAVAHASEKLERAKLAKAPEAEVRRLQKELDKVRAACDEQTVEMLLRSVGRKRWEELIRAHPPTDEQNEEVKDAGAGKQAPWNADTFPPAAIAASLVEPQLTEDEVREHIWDAWNSGEVTKLFTAALEVNSQSQLVEFGNFSNGTRGSSRS